MLCLGSSAGRMRKLDTLEIETSDVDSYVLAVLVILYYLSLGWFLLVVILVHAYVLLYIKTRSNANSVQNPGASVIGDILVAEAVEESVNPVSNTSCKLLMATNLNNNPP